MTHFVNLPVWLVAIAVPSFYPLVAWALGFAILFFSLRIYGGLLNRVLDGDGKVCSEPFGLPDLLVVIVLGSWLGGLAILGFLRPDQSRSMTSSDIVESVLMFGILVGGISAFLKYRHIQVMPLFGFRQVGAGRAIAKGFGLLLAAYPLVLLCNAAMQKALGDKAEPQKIVQFFIDAAQHSNRWSVIATVSIGILVAPLMEEFLFRGYIYGTLRRHLGPELAMLLNAALFAAIHVSVPVLPALFVLAICLTLAYEATGSLLVPMAMHALFNAVTLLGIVLSFRKDLL